MPSPRLVSGGQAQAGHRAAARQRFQLIAIQMGGMHQTPALIDRQMIIQPGYRALPAPRQAVVHLFLLLGDMNMHRQSAIRRGQNLLHLAQLHRTQRMEAQPLILQRTIRQLAGNHLLLVQIAFGILDKTFLPRLRRLRAETGVAVQHRQHRHADAGLMRGLAEAAGHFTAIGVRLTVGVVMQVVEFGHLGVSALEHFDIQLTGDHLHLLRRQALHQAVHQIAPGPEAVLRVARHFRQPGHRALESVGVQVRHARHRIAVQPDAALRFSVGGNLSQITLRIDVQPDVMRPALREQSAWGKISRHGSIPLLV